MKRVCTRIVAFLVLFLSAGFLPGGSEAAVLQDNWHYCDVESGASFSDILLPDAPENDTLFFETSGKSVRVTLGDQLVYAYDCPKEEWLPSYGRHWHLIKLPPITQPEQLRVEIQGKNRMEQGTPSVPSLDTARVQAEKIFLYDLPYVLSLPGDLLLALIILMYYFHQVSWKSLDLTLLLILFLLGVLSVSVSYTVQLFLDWPALWWVLSQGILSFLPVAGSFLIYQIVEAEFRWKIGAVIGIYGVLAVLILTAEFLGCSGVFYGYYPFFISVIIPCQFYTFWCLLCSMRKYQNVYSRFAVVPLIGFCFAGVFDGLNQFWQIMPWKTNLVPFCVYFLSMFVVCMMREQLLCERRMQEQANKLEYEIALAVERSEMDALTGCRNRAAFDRLMQQREGNFSMLMLDIDHFKKINDTWGHDAGDKVLQKFAALVREQLDKKHWFFRWGGEEFVVYCPHDAVEGGWTLAERIRRTVESAEILPEQQITVSIGIAYWHGADDSDIALFRRMDEALYRAKHEGRNCVMQE